ncbi:carbon-nitrogen family hydrolase [Halarchaeum sp. CBA1220]|uniref:nitrilase-related carbon-nitrogen hydrolase n=1 Tax=Halarchaeum sp. CBA1220 TaxID=1853682 RepID=UPI000F3A9143|nr:nitrilase-related carbon-nitrogen hydrolase [Halarchaeum sp. CBA1220]QLC34157.1 carbon-nitrogen family hydrolase [Halarchaeum sp. CBA1220]
MRLALAQFESATGDVSANERAARDAIADAAAAGADCVALPELWDVGYFAFDAYPEAAEPLDGARLGRIADLAAAHDVAVLAGSVVEDLAASASAGFETPAESGYANTSVLFDATGERRLVYRKHHLFGYDSAEADRLVPGERLETADLGGFTVAATTCYDLRFPELYRALLDRGATLVLVPSAWPYPRVEHWRTLARARAVENQWYLGAVNGVGTQDGTTLLGRSTVYDPWGTPVTTSDDEATTVYADVDPERVADVRAEFPALEDRRAGHEKG